MEDKTESIVPGVLIMLSAFAALIYCNMGYDVQYNSLWASYLEISFGPVASFSIKKQFLPLINEGFMAIFFLVVTIEIKHQCMYGSLNNKRYVAYPLIAAIGGMAVPAVIYLFFNYSTPYAVGWAIPTATDIAFSLACLLLLGKGFPPTMRIFLLSLAIFDDLGAIIIIALYYSGNLSLTMLLGSVLITAIMWLMNRIGTRLLYPYMLLSILLWLLMLKSGVHATLAGCVLAAMLPMRHDQGASVMALRERLQPLVQYFILPIFALANTGVVVSGGIDLLHPISLGIIGGLVLGKPIGIVAFGYIAERFGLAVRPHGLLDRHILGVSFLCGIGFTMSLFVGMLAFDEKMDAMMDVVRYSVLIASMCSAIIGLTCLYMIKRKGESDNVLQS